MKTDRTSTCPDGKECNEDCRSPLWMEQAEGVPDPMNYRMAASTVVDAGEEIAPTKIERDATRGAFVENWLGDHFGAIAFTLVAAAFAVRIFAATRSYLNPDEALHYLLFHQSSLWSAYRASLTNAHPPLIYLILYYWRFLGTSELMLRMPSVIAGTAFCWVLYRWIGNIFGRAAGLIALILAAFSPALVALSAEVRAYAVLLLCIACALYFLIRAFEENSVRRMWAFSAFLYLAILSHYSTVFFALAVGIYSLAKIVDSKPPRRFITAWVFGQLGALAIYGFLYVTHVSKIRNSVAVWAMPFGTAYFHSDTGNIFTFTGQSTFNVFLFQFGQAYIAAAMLLIFIAGVAILFGRDLLSQEKSQTSRLGILISFPFIAVWGGALAGIYPYVGSRHTVFLAPFAIAGASYFLATMSAQKLWAAVLVATLLVTLSNVLDRPVGEEVTRGDSSPAAMSAAINYMRQAIPQGDRILVDFQSSLPIAFYYCGPKKILPMDTFQGEHFEFTCNGNPITSFHMWKVLGKTFPDFFQQMARSHNLKPGDRVWVFQSGWGVNLNRGLDRNLTRFRCLAPNNFGDAITVIPFVVDGDDLPATPVQSCQNPPG